MEIWRAELNGEVATAEQLLYPALVNYGHFSTGQVRAGRIRGLALHLARLTAATQELFGVALDPDRVRDYLRNAVEGIDAATVRVTVFRPEEKPSVLVTVRPPVEPPTKPHRLRSVSYLRPLPHLKHTGMFGQIHYGERAEADGFDDALLTGPDGAIAEGSITNIGFFGSRDEVVWPDAPCLPGITKRLIEGRVPSRHESVRLADLDRFGGAFVTNSTGIAAVVSIDDLDLSVDHNAMSRIVDAYTAVPWDQI